MILTDLTFQDPSATLDTSPRGAQRVKLWIQLGSLMELRLAWMLQGIPRKHCQDQRRLVQILKSCGLQTEMFVQHHITEPQIETSKCTIMKQKI